MRSPGWLKGYQKVHESQLRPNELPQAYQGLTVAGIGAPEFRKLAQLYLTDFWTLAEAGKAPALLGRAGTFKTYTAAVIAGAVRERARVDVAFLQCGPELQELERRRYDPYSTARISWLCEAPFAVLDDFMKPRKNTYGADILDNIVERRYADGLPTLFTGNVVIERTATGIDDSTIITQFDVGFARRMREMTAGLTLCLKSSAKV